MDETYCALCGVCFGIDIALYHGRLTEQDVYWTDYFLAIRRGSGLSGAPSDSYYLSGVGYGIAYDGRAPASTYNANQDKDNEDAYDGDPVVAFSDRGDTKLEVVYPIHPDCWDLVLQNHARLSSSQKPNLVALGRLFARQDLEESGQRGLRPDWLPGFEYGDANRFWGDGWLYSEDVEASDVNQITQNGPELDYLVCDPKILPDFQDLSGNAFVPRKSKSASFLNESNTGSPDTFSCLPVAIRLNLLCLLPTISVQNLRLASRSMAATSLDSRYWRSRFIWPNELCHVPLPSSLGPGRVSSDDVDWSDVCHRLLHPPNPSQNLKNRNRILALALKLVKRLLSPVHGLGPEKAVDQKSSDVNPLQFVSCEIPEAFKTVSIHFPDAKAIQYIKTIFKQHDRDQVLTGITITDSNGSSYLGARDGEYNYSSNAYEGFRLTQVSLGFKENGIVGVAFEGNDGFSKEAIPGLSFGIFGIGVARGRINAGEGGSSIIAALAAGIAKDERIVRLGTLAPDSVDRVITWLEKSAETLWYPTFPPAGVSQTPTAGLDNGNAFAYMHHFMFANDEETLNHLTGISANLDDSSPGIFQLHTYFDDRNAVPSSNRERGKQVNFLIDGPGGERICALDIIRSQSSETVGVEIITSQDRSSQFTPASIPGPVTVQRIEPEPSACVLGIFGRIEVKDRAQSSLRSFGLLFTPPALKTPPVTTPPPRVIRRFDDHLNRWSDHVLPPPTYLFGEAFGGQPSRGYINWLDLKKPIKCITAGLSVTKRDVAGRPLDRRITGLKVDLEGEASLLLGHCESFGSHIELDIMDKIKSVTVGVITRSGLFALREVIFTTEKGIQMGFKDGDITSTIQDSSITRLFHSTSQLRLVGLAWAFALGSPGNRDIGLQPLYERRELNQNGQRNVHDTLYHSIHWQYPASKPPQGVYLRPSPSPDMRQYNFDSLSIFEEDQSSKLRTLPLATIRVYYNAFLQGIIFQYTNGVSRSLGNTVGQEAVFHIDKNEHVFAVWLHERVQPLEKSHGWVSGIRFGVVKEVEGKLKEHYSPFYGCAKPFGPFVNQQAGMREPSAGSSESVDLSEVRVRKLYLEPGTSFAGLYFESLDTYVRRAGILVSHINGLPEEIKALRPLDPTSPEDSTLLQHTQPDAAIPWLGPAPPSSYKPSPAIGQEKGIYRLWCLAPDQIDHITIHQHARSDHKIITVGLEFHSRQPARGEPKSSLLGHRTLSTRHTHNIFLDEDERVVGLYIAKGDERLQITMTSPPAILSQIHVLTSASPQVSQLPANDFSIESAVREGPKNTKISTSTLLADSTEKIVGFYAFVDEHIEGIGVLTEGE